MWLAQEGPNIVVDPCRRSKILVYPHWMQLCPTSGLFIASDSLVDVTHGESLGDVVPTARLNEGPDTHQTIGGLGPASTASNTRGPTSRLGRPLVQERPGFATRQ